MYEQRDTTGSVEHPVALLRSKKADNTLGHGGNRRRWGDVGGFQHQRDGRESGEARGGDTHIVE